MDIYNMVQLVKMVSRCLYNDDGFCKYSDAPIKMNFARACYDEFSEPMEEFVLTTAAFPAWFLLFTKSRQSFRICALDR